MSILSVPTVIRGRHIWDTLRMPAEEFHIRRSKMCALLADRGLDGVMCYADSAAGGYVEYFTNYNCVQTFTNALFLMLADGSCCLIASVPGRDVERIQNGFIPGDIAVLPAGMSPLACDHLGQKAVEYLASKGLTEKRWGGINLNRCLRRVAEDLESAVPGIVDLTDAFEAMRSRKTAAEIGVISQAAAFARQAALDLARVCRKGADECAAAAEVDRLIRYAGAEDVQLFIGTSASGGYLRQPQKRRLEAGEIVKILCQVQYLRYRGVFATTAVVGGGENDASRRIKQHADTFDRIAAQAVAGTAWSETWKTAFGIETNTHSAIQGMGQDLFEMPQDCCAPVRLEENMVLSVLLESNADCAIFADTILCTKKGAFSLSGRAMPSLEL